MATLPTGTQSKTTTVTTPDTYLLVAGATLTQTATTALQVTVTSGTTTLDIEGSLIDTASGARAIRANVAAGQLIVGAQGLVQSLDGDAVQAQAANAKFDVTNAGQIISKTSITTVTATGATPPGAAYALNFNAAVGSANAPATDFTSGGVITNGSAGNTAALIRSDSGDAIRLGAHETLVNYGRIAGAGPVNASSTNNVYSGTSTAQRYDISRGVRINAATSTNDTIQNYGTIEGSQHGVDVGNTAAANIVVNNAAGATILGHNGSGVGADTTGAAASTVQVTNAGTIRGEYAPTYDRAGLATTDGDGDGVDVDGGATVVNLAGGVIAGSGANGVLNGQGAGGYDSNGRANRSEGLSLGGGSITNDGLISGADSAIVVNNDSNADGSRSGVLATSITNNAAGTIIGQNGYAIRLENKTGSAGTDNDTILNYGTIIGNGTIPTGTVLRQDGTADAGTVGVLNGVTYTAADAGNARFIAGDGAAIQTGEGADTLSNYGTITGNTGRAISLEGGDDTLNLYTGGTVTGQLDGGVGTDTLNLLAGSGTGLGSLAAVTGFEVLAVQGGTWTLTDSQTYTSGITVAAGAGLILGGTAGALSGAVVDNGRLTLGRNGDVTVSDAISGSGVVEQAGTGTLTLAGTNSFGGGLRIGSGTVALAAAGAAGSGTITFAGAGTRLAVAQGATPTNAIAGFVSGDTIDLQGIGLASRAVLGAGNTLSVSGAAGGTVTLQLDPTESFAGRRFTVADDGANGTRIAVQTARPVPLDVNGNGTSDIVLQNGVAVTGLVLGGGQPQSSATISPDSDGYTVRASGDLNGDGTTDLVLQKGGSVVDWLLANGAYTAGQVLNSAVPGGLTVVGTGDFNGDGTSDVLLQDGGTFVAWQMKDGQVQATTTVGTGADGYTVVGTGDFNGDGTSDILLQSDRSVVAWLMKDGAYQASSVVSLDRSGFSVVGTGDFNGDGTDDIVLQSGGTVVDWLMANGAYQGGHVVGTGADGYTVAATGDYNGDGTTDLALQNGGAIVNWTLHDGTYQAGNTIATEAAGYTLVR